MNNEHRTIIERACRDAELKVLDWENDKVLADIMWNIYNNTQHIRTHIETVPGALVRRRHGPRA